MKNSKNFLQWLSIELFFTFSVISAVMFGVFSSSVSKSMHISPSMLGWLSGVFFIVYAITQFYSGRLFIIFSAKYVLLASTVISAGGAFMFSTTHRLIVLFLARVLLGIGLASTFVGVLFVVQNNFKENLFPVMSSLSQSIANLCAGIFGFTASMIIAKHDFRMPFFMLGIVFAICALLVILFFKNDKKIQMATTHTPRLMSSLLILIKNPQLWFASLYFSGLFGAILTFADLFNVSFQVEAFHESYATAAIINSMIPFGLTIGGIVAGFLAQKFDNYVIPVRVLGVLATGMFVIMIFVRFNPNYSTFIISIVSFIFGVGCSGSILAFQCIQKNIIDPTLRPLATSFVLTFSYIFSGMIEQPAVGDLIAKSKVTVVTNGNIVHDMLFNSGIYDHWNKYNNGLYFILVTIAISMFASIMFKTQRTNSVI